MRERVVEGSLNAEGLRLAIVASRFNDEITSNLLAGARDCLRRHGVDPEMVVIYRVPGAFEIPSLVARLSTSGRFDAIIAIGALIRGETPHFDFISAQVTSDLSRIAVESGTPVAYGVITCDTMEQARARAGERRGNKGWEAALAGIEMANLFREIARENP
ncbi:MAG TPA: 6,7-dimethyl-8-ribityllumazine synthase [Thermoanaerobaculia bacterium]|nr:6,7-dimethyl-8-ribityllumazine synthase [Thermoanaerobaculia bacterium]